MTPHNENSNSRFRVMNIVTCMDGNSSGRYAALLTERLSPARFDTMLVTGNTDHEDIEHYPESARTHILKHLWRGFNGMQDVRAFIEIYRKIVEFKPHIIHTHSTKAGLMGRVAGRLARVPVVLHTYNERLGRKDRSTAMKFMTQRFERMVTGMSDILITLHMDGQSQICDSLRLTNRGRTVLLPYATDTTEFSGMRRQTGEFKAMRDIAEQTPVVGIVDHSTNSAGEADLVAALEALQERMPGAHFVILGRRKVDSLPTHLENVTQVVNGDISKSTLFSDMNVCMVMDSRDYVIQEEIEALAAGCPVVVLRRSAFGSAASAQMDYRFEVTDLDNAVAAVESLVLNPPDLTATREHVANSYTIDRLIPEIESLYNGLLLRKGQHLDEPAILATQETDAASYGMNSHATAEFPVNG